ncbi:MAG: sigma-70 family RNA polymerase sigma factor [Planctomycetes bacterium]|nr:sigma-70 family RNA polymerase sigma factor [Planctomycetota bacterium]
MARGYWWPLHCFLVRSGVGPDEAGDLVQGFLVSLLERNVLAAFEPAKGRFRTFVLACLKGYWGDEKDRRRAQKRGGGKAPLPLDSPSGRRLLDLPDRELSPEDAYQRAWAITTIEWAVAEVRRELEARAETKALEILGGYLQAENLARPGHAELATRTGLPERTVRHLLEYVRKQIRRALLHRLRAETSSADEAREELAWLFACLEKN